MSAPDLSAVVELHVRAFPHFFLSFLGPAFLRELYSAILADVDGIAVVCGSGTAVLGFVAGTSKPGQFYWRLLRERWWRFASSSVIPLMKQPRIAPRLLRALSSPQTTEKQCGGACLLMSLAVHPEAQGTGLGRKLICAFLAEARRRGTTEVRLTTDALANDAVNRFYRDVGFRVDRQLMTPEGRLMNEYRISL
jgi:ribosomal protein S18 acetylase RimI-like enzyme